MGKLSERDIAERLLAEVNRQLRARRLEMRRGNLVDATRMCHAASATNRLKDGTAHKGRDLTLGDKLPAAVDDDTGIVRRITLTPTLPHEGAVVKVVLPADVGDLGIDAAMALARCAIITEAATSCR